MKGVLRHRSKTATLYIVTAVAVIIALSACDTGQSDMPADDDEVMLTLRLSLPETERDATTRAITSVEENAIDIAQLKVLVFKAVGTTETFSYEAPQVLLQGGKYTVTLKQSRAGEKYRLVVIANAGNKLPIIPENTSKNDALKMITFGAGGKWNATGTTNYTRFPMWERRRRHR